MGMNLGLWKEPAELDSPVFTVQSQKNAPNPQVTKKKATTRRKSQPSTNMPKDNGYTYSSNNNEDIVNFKSDKQYENKEQAFDPYCEQKSQNYEHRKAPTREKYENFETSQTDQTSYQQHHPPKRDLLGTLSSFLNSGSFDVTSLLGLIGNGKDSSMLSNILPLFLGNGNKKPAHDSTGNNTINISDYKRVK